MQARNVQSLERLSLFCHVGGLAIIFLGISVAGLNLMNGDKKHVQEGIFIFVTGYAFVKISSKVAAILNDEKNAKY